jgi:alpha-mannosidase
MYVIGVTRLMLFDLTGAALDKEAATPASTQTGASSGPIEASAVISPAHTLLGIVVNHTHWDREWYLPFQRYRVMLVDAVDHLLEILSTRSDYGDFLLDGQTAVVDDYLEILPEKREELARYVRSGRIGLGPWYVLPDEFIPTGEGLIRNLLMGRKQMRELGAPPARVGYLPDTFGHPAQLPQLLAGFDLESSVIFRGVKSITSEFIWEAPDGTQLLTIYLPGGYYNAMELARAPQHWLNERMEIALDQLAQFATTKAVLLMNGCDHFEPQAATQEILDESNRRQHKVYLRQGTLEEYVERVREANPKLEVIRREWRTNRPARITPGVLSTRMYLKQADFQSSVILERGAEPLQALTWALGGKHDTGLLGTAWKYLLQNHPHDSICGCSLDEVHRDGEGRYRWAQQIGGDLVERATGAIAKQIDSQDGPGFALFNTLASPRREIVRQHLNFFEPGVQFKLVDSNGNDVPYQEISRRIQKIEYDPQREEFYPNGRTHQAVVVAPAEQRPADQRWQRWIGEEVEILLPANLPPGGYTVIGVRGQKSGVRSQDSEKSSSLIPHPSSLENELVRVEVAGDGSFTLSDKATGRSFGPLNVFRSEADRGDEYSFCPAEGDKPVYSRGGQASVKLVESGPLSSMLEISLTMKVPAALTEDRTRRTEETIEIPILSYVTLKAGSKRVEIRTELENTARDQRFRALFYTGVHSSVADAQGQFMVMQREVELPIEERLRVPEFDEEQEVSYHPQRAFVDVSDERGGLALLNKGLPEYEAEPSDEGVILGVTLLRSVGWLSREDLSTRYKHAGPPLLTPEAQCLGKHVFDYAVMPHEGDWLVGGVAQEAEAYITPVYAAALEAGEKAGGSLPTEASFYSFGPKELIFSACKRSEDGKALVLRAYNTAPYPVEAEVLLAAGVNVRLANLAERELSKPLTAQPGNSNPATYRFPVRAHEIITLSIRKDEECGMKDE